MPEKIEGEIVLEGKDWIGVGEGNLIYKFNKLMINEK
jgi:hypothetical protein